MNEKYTFSPDGVFKLVGAGKHDEALVLIDNLMTESPENPWLWRYRSYVNSMRVRDEDALLEINRAIELASEEPDFFFTRGRIFFLAGEFKEAVADFTTVVQLGDAYGNDYYLEAAYMHRADAYLRRGEFEKAKLDCEHVRDQIRLWTDRLRTKADILEECQ